MDRQALIMNVVVLQLEPNLDKRDAIFKQQAAKLPAKAIGTPDDVARVIVAIASSPFTTGSVIHINGGSFLV